MTKGRPLRTVSLQCACLPKYTWSHNRIFLLQLGVYWRLSAVVGFVS